MNPSIQEFKQWVDKNYPLLSHPELHDKLNVLLLKNDKSTISDGFGNTWSSICHKCGKDGIRVVRVGEVQCSYCNQ